LVEALAVAAVMAIVPACSSRSPSTLNTEGPASHRIADLWWFMFWVSAAVVAVVATLVLIGIVPRRRRSAAPDGDARWTGRMVLFGGVVVPVLVLSVLWGLTLHNIQALSSPGRAPALTVKVVGHRWWWEVRYPAQGIVTANDIHIPAGQPVRVVLSSIDVNHSFWVPQLTAKTDLIPGHTTSMWIQADRPGTYRGQCAEFCGLQHANMIFFVIAEQPAAFGQWVAREAAAPAPPATTLAQVGQQVFTTQPCVACHTVKGTKAQARIGPDLSHFGSRVSIGSGALPNTPDDLAGWVSNAQVAKPGALMPPVPLTPEDIKALVAYLEGLK
jgi:cytochrome c oxidase subunit II